MTQTGPIWSCPTEDIHHHLTLPHSHCGAGGEAVQVTSYQSAHRHDCRSDSLSCRKSVWAQSTDVLLFWWIQSKSGRDSNSLSFQGQSYLSLITLVKERQQGPSTKAMWWPVYPQPNQKVETRTASLSLFFSLSLPLPPAPKKAHFCCYLLLFVKI